MTLRELLNMVMDAVYPEPSYEKMMLVNDAFDKENFTTEEIKEFFDFFMGHYGARLFWDSKQN